MFTLPENQEIQNCKIEVDFWNNSKRTKLACVSGVGTVQIKNTTLDCSKTFEFKFEAANEFLTEKTFSYLLTKELLNDSHCTMRVVYDGIEYRYTVRDLKHHVVLFSHSVFNTSFLLNFKNTKDISYIFQSVSVIPCTK